MPVPGPLRRAMAPLFYRGSVALGATHRPPPPPPETLARGPMVVSGFLDEVLGIGRAGRLTFEALQTAGLQPVAHRLRPVINLPPYETAPFPSARPGGVWLAHCNAPEAELVLSRHRIEDWRPRYLIGYWAWELPELPRSWRRTARLYHEIWAPSAFVADAIRPYAPRVRVAPHPVPLAQGRRRRSRFGLEEGRFYFAVMADARSAFARKGPLEAVAAYRRAFPQPGSQVGLVVKLVKPEADPLRTRSLHEAIAGRSDIMVLVEDLSDQETMDFLASADAVVSLHRAEGFGLVLAEALSMGVPVLATGWSGNIEFMSGLPELLIPFRLATVKDASGRYKGARWAEPEVDAAAERMKTLVASSALRDLAREKGPPAIARLSDAWSPEAMAEQPWSGLIDLQQGAA